MQLLVRRVKQKTATEKAQTVGAGATELIKEASSVIGKQKAKLDEEIKLTIEQTNTAKAQTAGDVSAVLVNGISVIRTAEQNSVIGRQKELLVNQALEIAQKTITELAQTIGGIAGDTEIIRAEKSLIGKQKAKLDEEIKLVIENTNTAKAQTSGDTSNEVINGISVSRTAHQNSVIGRQKEILINQALEIKQKTATELAQTVGGITSETVDVRETKSVIGKQKAKLDEEIKLVIEQTNTAKAQTSGDASNEVINGISVSRTAHQNSILGRQKDVLINQALEIKQKTVTELAQTTGVATLVDGNIPARTAVRNSVIGKQGAMVDAQTCKLQAEFDLIKETELKTAQEKALLLQKTATEKAQIDGSATGDNSVIGKQKALYAAQTSGFKRDAEQKASKILVDSYSVNKTVEPGTTLPTALAGIKISEMVTIMVNNASK